MAVAFRYGGARGKRLRLMESNEYMVVRTKSRDALAQTPIGREAHERLRGWLPVVRFYEAGVEILHSGVVPYELEGLAPDSVSIRALPELQQRGPASQTSLHRSTGVRFDESPLLGDDSECR